MTHNEQHSSTHQIILAIKKMVKIGAPRPFYPANEAMAILDGSRSWLNKLIKEERLEVMHINKRIYISHRSLMRLVMGDDYHDSIIDGHMHEPFEVKEKALV